MWTEMIKTAQFQVTVDVKMIKNIGVDVKRIEPVNKTPGGN